MNNKFMKKLVALFMLLSIIFSNIFNLVYAFEVNQTTVQDKGDCGYHLQYWSTAKKAWSFVKTTYVTYNKDGIEHPAYCLDSNAQGVDEYGDYSVDVTSILEDYRIWRVIKNGYPYKSPAEIGVENYLDAFVATKQAVYSIIYGFDAGSRYRGGDARGTAIANAIVNLVDIGRNGTETPYNAGMKANKIGDFVKDGDYYSQEYQVECGVRASEYTIIDANGMPSGTIITDVNGNQKTTFSGNENFKIKIPISQLTNEINIIFRIQGKAEVYPIFYGKSNIPGTQDYALTFDPLGDVVGVGDLNVKVNTGKIMIHKTDSETSEPISGVTFQLTRDDGSVVSMAITDGNGIATFSELLEGNYILKEIATNKNYVLNTMDFSVNVKYNETTNVDITNDYKKGQIKVIKVDKDNNEVRLKDIEFKVMDEKGNVVDTIKTDKNRRSNYKKIKNKSYIYYSRNKNFTKLCIKYNSKNCSII